jgi:predicted AlkP superfamily pyrophosphatase or phosphodiesterase
MGMNRLIILFFTVLMTLSAVPVLGAETPRLVLQITVDQLRGDLPTRYRDSFGEGGFRYLFEEGLYYGNAHYQHANTETIVGHASLATGAYPAVHGMVGNLWLDHDLDRLVYNIEDPDYLLLSADADVNEATEIDPTQRAAKVEGRSPRAILSSTFGDELRGFTGGQSRVFGVSVKDRGAVALAGHTGKAFWFSKSAGEFVTSTYYYDEYPDYVTEWNAQDKPSAYANTSWNLMKDRDNYLFGLQDDRPWETDFPGYGRTFPHAYGPADNPLFTTKLTLSPAGDELTLDFALALMDAEALGQDEVTDFLAISFSSTDYVGHLFGASSLEMEDNLLRLDRTLAKLFAHVDETVGLENTLIVLSADHGGPDTPGYLEELGYVGVGYFDTNSLEREPAIAALRERFGIGEQLIDQYSHPYLHLNREAIAAQGLELAEVQQAVALELAKFPGIREAVPSTSLQANAVPDFPLMEMVRNNFHPGRSGDVYVIFDANVFINDFDGLVVASTHGSPWSYDTFVPIFFAGQGIKNGSVYRPVTPYDIAPTLSARLGARPPSGATGQPLAEVMDN